MADHFNTLDQATVTSAGIIDGTIVGADISASAALSVASLTATGELAGSDVKVTGLTGAANQGRFVGVTTSGSPASGTFAVGDFIVTQNGQMFVCVVAGTPGTWVTPRDTRDLISSGEETVARDAIGSATLASNTQALRLTYFTARKSETTTQVTAYVGGTGAGATPTLCRMGLYLIAADGSGTLVASTANDTSLFGTPSVGQNKAWQAGYAKVAGQRYAFGVLVVTAATAPTFVGQSLQTAPSTTAPRLTSAITGQADLPATFVSGSLTSSTSRIYAEILP